MTKEDLRANCRRIVERNPELRSEVTDIFDMAISEIEDGGSESHECELATEDLDQLELKHSPNGKQCPRCDRWFDASPPFGGLYSTPYGLACSDKCRDRINERG